MEHQIFIYTDKQLKKKYSKQVLDKYYIQLAYLYQNGYDLNCSETEIEEQFELFNNFSTEEDYLNLFKLFPLIESEIGNKIFLEEIFDILKFSSFLRRETTPIVIKNLATLNWDKLTILLERINNLFKSKDRELLLVYKNINIYQEIIDRLNELEEKVDEELKTYTWMKFVELNAILYSLYVKLSKSKTEQLNISKVSNINDELYGGIGGYNLETGEIKCILGSAVWELKTVKNTKSVDKIKSVARNVEEEYLTNWLANKETNTEKARQIVVNSLLFGILSLLSIKYNLTLTKDVKNSERAENIQKEFKRIMEYCNISYDYLL